MAPRRRILATLLPCLLLPQAAGAADAALQQEVLRQINMFRARMGAPPLRLDARLSRAALAHSADMLSRNAMTHTGRDGSDPGARISRAGYRWRAYRENVGAGYMDAREAVAGWIGSPPHRDNLLAREVTDAGIGFAKGPGMMAGNIPRLFWTLVLAAPR